MFADISIYQNRARTHWNYIARFNGRIVGADIGFTTEAAARAAALSAIVS
jgi:hypothetical protein